MQGTEGQSREAAGSAQPRPTPAQAALPPGPSLPPAPRPVPDSSRLSPHLSHADHALGHVQIALVVLADLGNDETWVLPAHPAPRTQLQLQRHGGGSRPPAARPVRVPPPPRWLRSAPRWTHTPAPPRQPRRRAANPQARPRSRQPIRLGGRSRPRRAARRKEEVRLQSLELGVWLAAASLTSDGLRVRASVSKHSPKEGEAWLPSAWTKCALRCNGKKGSWSYS